MKRIKIAGIAGVAIIGMMLTLFSCGDKTNSSKESVGFDTFSFKSYAIGNDADSIKSIDPEYSGLWEISATGVIPASVGKHDVKQLRDTLLALANIKEVDGKLTSLVPDYLTDYTEKVDTTKVRSVQTTNLSVKLMNTQVLVMQIFNFAYSEGAAHGNFSNLYLNYDLQNGKILSVTDIFLPGFEDILMPEILAQLKGNGVLLLDEDNVTFPQTFRLTEDGVEFVYGIYSIAPYAAGEPRVGFYSSDLQDVLTPEGKRLVSSY